MANKIKRKFLVSWCLGGKGFTLIELVVAIALLVMVVGFSGVVFQRSIGSYRAASAQAEIMRKLRAITEQLNSDFQGLQKDGYLILRCELMTGRTEYTGAVLNNFRADRIYFFCTGDFQSWYRTGLRSNIARVYFGHEGLSLADTSITVNRWRLAHDAHLLCPGEPIPAPPLVVDFNNLSFAEYKANPVMVAGEADAILAAPPAVDIAGDPNTVRLLLCENAGQLKIDWTYGATDIDGAIIWFGSDRSSGIAEIEPFPIGFYKAQWLPSTPANLWPRALKFTFTIYDSRKVFKNGQTFTHIVYLGD